LADTTSWWTAFDGVTKTGVSGYGDGAFTGSTAGTDAIRIQFFEDTGLVTSSGMGSTSGALAVSSVAQIEDGQILMACGFFPSSPSEPVTDTASVFSAGKSGSNILHDEDSGNASDDFTDAAQPTAVVYPTDTLIGSMRAMEWYVAVNDQGKNSLFRRQLVYSGGVPAMGAAEEIVNDVIDMDLTYLEGTTWTAAPTSWNNVTAVQVDLELEASDNRAGGVEGQMIRRKMSNIIALRNKL
jgi:hypothetical protein